MRRSEALQGVRMIKFRSVLERYEVNEFNQLEAAEVIGANGYPLHCPVVGEEPLEPAGLTMPL